MSTSKALIEKHPMECAELHLEKLPQTDYSLFNTIEDDHDSKEIY